MNTRYRSLSQRLLPLLVLLALLLVSSVTGARDGELTLELVQRVFPTAQAIELLKGDVPAYRVSDGTRQLGYAFTTLELAPISAYSGKPINTLVGIDSDGVIRGVSILQHEEPILVIGVSDADLASFIAQFVGKSTTDQIRVGAHAREGFVGIDGISGATITTMVLTSAVNKAVHKVDQAYRISPSERSVSVAGSASAQASGTQSEPVWTILWQERIVELVIVCVALLVLLLVLFFQDWLVKRKVAFHRFRVMYLLFTVFFIGFYCSAQLSVVNLLAFFRSIGSGFSWDTLLIEPVVFVLWAFVAVSILFWGRGVFCGWLCPFGAAQDLISKLAKRIGIQGYRLPQMVHERLWSIKYFILIALVGLSLDSMVNAAKLAEVEPFKTTFVLHFDREPMFVLYALALLGLSAINSKFYCKYLCPLGAGLSFATRFRIFDWLRRRRECGKPCQSCAHDCQIAAIKPTGEIIDNECHYCLECQVTYWDDHRCPPLVERRKKRAPKGQDVITSDSQALH